MNDFLDKLGAAARRAAGTVSTEVNIAAQEQRIRESYQALGKLCWQAHQEGRALGGAEFDAIYGKISACMERIEELRASQKVTVEPTAKPAPVYKGEVVADETDFILVEE